MALLATSRRPFIRKARALGRLGPEVSLGYRRILVAVAESSESERAVDYACRLAAEHGASITAVAVIELPPLLPLDAHMVVEEAAARRLLDRAAAIATSYGVDISPRIVRARQAASAIVDLLKEQHIEMLAIGAPRKVRASSRSPIFGSTVQHLLKGAPCRVMVITEAPAAVALSRHAAA